MYGDRTAHTEYRDGRGATATVGENNLRAHLLNGGAIALVPSRPEEKLSCWMP